LREALMIEGKALAQGRAANHGDLRICLKRKRNCACRARWPCGPCCLAAQAQDVAQPGDIVVTATKQATSINRVPISITAITQATMDRTNIRNFSDIVRTVPGLAIQADPSADRVPNISIRGIASSSGAATTGIYVDDIPLQKRNAIGISGSGTPIPHLFDLERVEVLRGPQGTLFGGSSLGGAIRFITPAPDLEKAHIYVRSEVAGTRDGSPSFSQGAAISLPIVPGTLAIRASADVQYTGGYIDHVNRFTGAVIAKDTNSAQAGSYRVALLWSPSAAWKITPSFYYSYDNANDTSTQWASIPATVSGGHSYGAVNFGKYQSGQNCNVGDDYASTANICATMQPRKQRFFVPSVKIEGDLGVASITSVTSYIDDKTTGSADYSYIEPSNFSGGYPFVSNLPLYKSTPVYENTRHGWTQEVRLAGKDQGGPFNWLVGGFFAHYTNNSNYHINANLGDLTQAVFGAAPEDVFGVGVEPGNVTYHRDQDLREETLAGFGEASYKLGRLKAIAGVRVSQEIFAYHQATAGTFAGFLTPTTANGGLTDGRVRETPVTPRFALQYQLDPRVMFYATAAKGFRVGGVNQPPRLRAALPI
jgi:outer membrane receptor protein involved in Fe transport